MSDVPSIGKGWGPPQQPGNGLAAELPERGGPVFVTSAALCASAGLQFRPGNDLPVTPGRAVRPSGLQRGPVIG